MEIIHTCYRMYVLITRTLNNQGTNSTCGTSNICMEEKT